MTDVLSQDEIEKLLSSINCGYDNDNKEPAISDENNDSEKYAFRDEDDAYYKFSKEQIRGISLIHEKFARMAKNNFLDEMRSYVNINVASTTQLSIRDFYRSTPDPAVIGIFSMEPLKGCAMLEIDPVFISTVISGICGGIFVEKKLNSELTDIGKSIMEFVFNLFLEDLKEAWSEIIDIQPKLVMIETHPFSIQLYPLKESHALITFETYMRGEEGMINLCLPYPLIEPVLNKFSYFAREKNEQ